MINNEDYINNNYKIIINKLDNARDEKQSNRIKRYDTLELNIVSEINNFCINNKILISKDIIYRIINTKFDQYFKDPSIVKEKLLEDKYDNRIYDQILASKKKLLTKEVLELSDVQNVIFDTVDEVQKAKQIVESLNFHDEGKQFINQINLQINNQLKDELDNLIKKILIKFEDNEKQLHNDYLDNTKHIIETSYEQYYSIVNNKENKTIQDYENYISNLPDEESKKQYINDELKRLPFGSDPNIEKYLNDKSRLYNNKSNNDAFKPFGTDEETKTNVDDLREMFK